MRNPAEPHDRNTPIGAGGNAFPTWSWTSWTGRKQYRLTETDRNSFNSLDHQHAGSEISQLQILQHGELVHIRKSPEAMTATEVRNPDIPSRDKEGKYDKAFPKHVPYTVTLSNGIHGPDFGSNVLQFWAYTVGIDAFKVGDMDGTLINDPEYGAIPGQQVVNKLLDSRQKHCGLLFKPQPKTTYREKRISLSVVEFVLISSFGNIDERRSGIETRDPGLRPFDERAFPWKDEGSGLVTLMLMQWFGDVAERVTVAQMHRLAWESARPVRKHVRLA